LFVAAMGALAIFASRRATTAADPPSLGFGALEAAYDKCLGSEDSD